MKITYQLRPEEIEEAWISAQWRAGIFQKWNQLFLTVIALGLVFAYAMKPDRFYLMMCAVPVVILLFCNAYLLGAVRRRRARQLAKKKGTYGIELRKSGICAGKDWTFYPLKDRRWELLNSEHVYAIKVDKEVFCIPKRVVPMEEKEALEALKKVGECKYRNIITGKEKVYGKTKYRKDGEPEVK